MISIKKNVVIALLALFLIQSKTECLFSGFWNQLSVITGYKFKKEQENISVTGIENVSVKNVGMITYEELGQYVPQTLFDLFIGLFQAQWHDKKSFATACSMQNNNSKSLPFKPLLKEEQKSFIKNFCEIENNCFRAIGENLIRSYQPFYYKIKSRKALNNILDTIQVEAESHSNQNNLIQ